MSVEGKQCISSSGVSSVKVKEYSYTWTIQNFKFCYREVGESLISPFFTTGDGNEFEWQLMIYPNGSTVESEGYLDIFVGRIVTLFGETTEPATRVYLIISIDSEKKKDVRVEKFIEIMCKNKERIFEKFVKKDELYDESNGLLPNGNLTIRCKMYFEDGIVQFSRPIEQTTLEHRLTQFDDFEKLLDADKFSDVKLAVGDKEFYAHKIILSARSRVFAAMFEHNMTENKEKLVKITDIESDVMQEVLRFIYAGKVKNLRELALGLLAAADKYELDGLKIMCEGVLIDTLSIKNIGVILATADQHRTDKLKTSAIEFLTTHRKDLIETDGFKKIMGSLSSPLLADVIDIMMLKL